MAYVVKTTAKGDKTPYLIDGFKMDFGRQRAARRFKTMWEAAWYVFHHGWPAEDNGLRVVRLKPRSR